MFEGTKEVNEVIKRYRKEKNYWLVSFFLLFILLFPIVEILFLPINYTKNIIDIIVKGGDLVKVEKELKQKVRKQYKIN